MVSYCPNLGGAMIRTITTFALAALMLLGSTALSAQRTDGLTKVVLSKPRFGTVLARLPTPVDDVAGHLLQQTYRIDDVTSSDPAFFNGVREYVYIQSETFGDGSRRYNVG